MEPRALDKVGGAIPFLIYPVMKLRTLRSVSLTLLASVALLAAAPFALRAQEKAKSKTPERPPLVLKSDAKAVNREAADRVSYSAVVKKTAPSVVNVFSSKKVRAQREMSPFFNDPQFRRYFGVPEQDDRGGRGPTQEGQGSGVIISTDGYILTNNHVVEDADEVEVAFGEPRREFKATIVGRDPKADIAVIKIDATGLTAATLGDSDQLEVGDVVLAIGNPFGVGQSVSSGIVSALSRGAMRLTTYEDFIQTDAAINPGNSGGPLIDFEGRLLGMNTAIKSGTGLSVGLGYSIPSNLIAAVALDLANQGRVVRGLIGVQGEDLSVAEATKLSLGQAGAVRLVLVSDEMPAAKAGLKVGDIVVGLNGKPVENWNEMRLEISRRRPGEVLTLNYIREGRGSLARLTVAERPLDR